MKMFIKQCTMQINKLNFNSITWQPHKIYNCPYNIHEIKCAGSRVPPTGTTTCHQISKALEHNSLQFTKIQKFHVLRWYDHVSGQECILVPKQSLWCRYASRRARSNSCCVTFIVKINVFQNWSAFQKRLNLAPTVFNGIEPTLVQLCTPNFYTCDYMT